MTTTPPPLRRPTPGDLSALAVRLGDDRVATARDTLDRYARDESTVLTAMPTAVVRPRSAAEVAETLRWASAGPFGVVPRGAGTGVAGGALALEGEVVLSVEHLDRIVEVDVDNLTLTCEPGVVTQRVHEAAREHGLFYPPDPASFESCSIGGNVVVGAGGARAVKYGVTRDYVLGLQVVLADGTLLDLGGKNVKNASGYHLLDLMVGSEGTLGIVTRVILRLVPLPSRRVALLAPFENIGAAARGVRDVLHCGTVPAVAEFMDEVTIEAARRYLGRTMPGGERARAYVFIELDGDDPRVLTQQLARVGKVLSGAGALEILAAEDEGQQARLWESRRCLGDALKAWGRQLGKADVAVPRARVPDLVEAIKALASEHGVTIACFGHAGDGNVHVNVLRGDRTDNRWAEVLPPVMEAIMAETRRLDGIPSGEHGIGALKRGHLRRFLSGRQLSLMAGIKMTFDPKGILNPGKVL